MELITFTLIAYGLTQILVYSDMPLIKRLRPSKEAGRGYGKVFHCPMCMGFHVGWFLMLLSPFTELFNFDITVTNFFLLGWLSSGTSYVLNMVFGDKGIQYSQTMEMTGHED
tara:strand:+ start:191 stop:526 length:336 start_codon:yes stop_codon:yes gene_type:complete